MTIDEEIVFERKLADYYKDNNLKNEAKEHEQLAEWLEELKLLRQWKSDVMDEFCKYDCNSVEEAWHYGYNKAIEEYNSIKELDLSIPQHFTKEQSDWIKAYCIKRNIESYNEAIDDLIAKCENAKFAESDEIALSDIHTGVNSGLSMSIHLAEQLKAGGENESKQFNDKAT